MEELIKVALRDIRQAYHSAVSEWTVDDQKAMLTSLTEALQLTRGLIELIEGKEGKDDIRG